MSTLPPPESTKELCCAGALPIPTEPAPSNTTVPQPPPAQTVNPNPAPGSHLDIAVQRSRDQANTPFAMQVQATLNDTATTSIAISSSSLSSLRVYMRGGAGESSRSAMPTHSTTSGGKTFATYQDIVAYARDRKCQQCNKAFITSVQDIQKLFTNWQSNGQGGSVTSYLKCQSCEACACIGCGAKINGSRQGNAFKVNGLPVTWCCSRGRTFLIWVALCGFDMWFCAEKGREAEKKGHGPSAHRGIGYSDDFDDFMEGNWLFRRGTGQNMVGRREAAMSAEQRADQFYGIMFAMLAELLPSVDKRTTLDMNAPQGITSLLINSKVLRKAAEFLRNDSMENIARRKEVYQALFKFLRIVATHPATGEKTFLSERQDQPNTLGLLTLSFRSGGGDATELDNTSSLASHLRNLNIQSTMIMRGAVKNEQVFKDRHGQNMLWLCRQISDLSELLLAETPEGSGAAVLDAKDVDADSFIADADDQLVLRTHAFAVPAMRLRNGAKGRMKRLITEVTTLKTALPPGIFVKYASSRLDVMKILIIGPEDTPYEHGIFEFDLFCTAEYPFRPPVMKFKTAIPRDSVMFNPNLHPDGKVCLSLLGTWDGEPWLPGQSTILQVLISIQAMIFNDNPESNEPGHGGRRDSLPARGYNEIVRYLTVRFALLAWMESAIPALWKDVVECHFKKNGNKIVKTIEEWARIPPIPPHLCFYLPFLYELSPNPTVASLIPRLQKGLQRFGVDTSALSTIPVNPHQSRGADFGRDYRYGPGGGYGMGHGMGGQTGGWFGGVFGW